MCGGWCSSPPEFCRPVIARRLTPVQFWREVCQPVLTAGKQAACQQLIDYGRAILMQPAVGPPLGPHVGSTLPTILAADDLLVAQRLPEVQRDLPGLFARVAPAAAPPGQPDLAALIAEALVGVRNAAAVPLVAGEAQKTARDRWPVAYTTLLSLCDKEPDEVGDLPPVWAELANARKGEERRVLEMAVQARANERFGVGSAVDMVVPADLATKVKQLMFLGPEPKDLELGINVFSLPFLSSAQMAEAMMVAAEYDAMHGGSHASLEDIRKLGASGKVILPSTVSQATQTLKRHSLLVDVMLGTDHPLARRWQTFFATWERRAVMVETLCASPPNMPARLLFALHLREYQWWRQVVSTPAHNAGRVLVPTPDFEEVLDRLELEDFPVPEIPLRYLQRGKADGGIVGTPGESKLAASATGGGRGGKAGESRWQGKTKGQRNMC